MRWKLHVRFGERAGETDQHERLTLRPGPTQPDLLPGGRTSVLQAPAERPRDRLAPRVVPTESTVSVSEKARAVVLPTVALEMGLHSTGLTLPRIHRQRTLVPIVRKRRPS